MKKVLIISSSLRNGSNSEFLAQQFARGAQDASNQTEFISLKGKNINYCLGCMRCQQNKKCVIDDDAVWLAEKAKNCDVLVFATPVYYYGMCGQLKTLLDRFNPLYSLDYKFREIYILATAHDDDVLSATDGVENGFMCWLKCFDKAKLKGVVRGLGIEPANSAVNCPDMLSSAYSAGKNV